MVGENVQVIQSTVLLWLAIMAILVNAELRVSANAMDVEGMIKDALHVTQVGRIGPRSTASAPSLNDEAAREPYFTNARTEATKRAASGHQNVSYTTI